MRVLSFAILPGTLAVALACAACATGSTGPNAMLGTWGSNQATLTNQNNATTLRLNASGCYGSYGELDQPIRGAQFKVSGIYTQLIGAYPGEVQYAAEFSGQVQGQQMHITVHIPSLNRDIGPLLLFYGVSNSWQACEYP